MSKVDTSTWKPFCVGDLFEVLLAKGDIQPKQCEDGETLLVSAGNEDNGVAARISVKGDGVSELFSARCITVSMFGRAFWQNESFYAVSHGRVNILQPKQTVSDMTGLFLATALNAATGDDFNYQTMCTRARLIDISIMLPATPDGDPDWAYMESYMKDVMDREEVFASHLASLTAEAVADGHVVDTSGWKAFRVVDLGFSIYHGQRLNKAQRIDGETLFITAGFENRGVTQYIGNDRPTYYKAITVDMFGNCFFQPEDCAGDDNVYFFVNDDVSDLVKLFISSGIGAMTSAKFDYARQFRQGDADNLKVMLPATLDGDPDWFFMEAYMKSVMEREVMFADELNKLVM